MRRPAEFGQRSVLPEDGTTGIAAIVLAVGPTYDLAKVVNRLFINRLKDLLGRGVNVIIGYGLGEDRGCSDRDQNAIDELKLLANSYSNMKFIRLGNTHAKVLIQDSDFAVVTSFN